MYTNRIRASAFVAAVVVVAPQLPIKQVIKDSVQMKKNTKGIRKKTETQI